MRGVGDRNYGRVPVIVDECRLPRMRHTTHQLRLPVAFVVFCLAGVGIGASVAIIVVGEQENRAVLEIDCDFGVVYPVQRIVHTFSLPNRFDEVLEVIGVRNTCGCIGSRLETSAIPTKRSSSLEVTLQMSDNPGKKRAQVFVSARTATTKRPTGYPCSAV